VTSALLVALAAVRASAQGAVKGVSFTPGMELALGR
jgi:hypothetical protein